MRRTGPAYIAQCNKNQCHIKAGGNSPQLIYLQKSYYISSCIKEHDTLGYIINGRYVRGIREPGDSILSHPY
jgi:hypothetical protein